MTKMIWNCFLQPPTWVTCSESPAANLESSSQGARPPSYSHGDCCWGWWWCCSWGLSYRRPCLPISASSASQNQFQILLFPTKQAAHCRASSMFTAAAKRSQRWAKLKSWTKSRKRGNTQPPTRPPEGKRFTGLPAALLKMEPTKSHPGRPSPAESSIWRRTLLFNNKYRDLWGLLFDLQKVLLYPPTKPLQSSVQSWNQR